MAAARAERGGIVLGESAEEFFREAVADALSHQRLRVREATERYLAGLLAGFLQSEALFAAGPGGSLELEPLALGLLDALSARPGARLERLRRVGDTSLFVSGFFGDSLAGRAADLGYHVAMGERAYRALAGGGPAGSGELFGELAARFEALVDCIAEIAELSDLRSNRGLVRLYRRFLATGSTRLAERLRERGVALFAGPGPGAFRQ